MNATTSSAIDRWLVRRIHRWTGHEPIRVVLGWDGTPSPLTMGDLASVIISDRRALLNLLLNPEVGFGDAYSEGRIEVKGDLVRLLEAVFRLRQSGKADSLYARIWSRWLERIQRNTPRGSRRNIHHHYDLDVDFYKLWLDPRMVYTCAYFPSSAATLEEAQIAKMEHVCRKLQLQPGETIVEAGCGWGALALYMAKHYGVKVKAFNISHEQILYAREQAAKEGLGRQVEFIEDDYRNIAGRFDVFVSVGMLEHVGRDHYAELGRIVRRTIGDSGRGLFHFIGRNQPFPLSAWIRKRIFPGGYVPTIRQVMDIFEPGNYAVLDVENLRFHYAKTLEHWLDGFEKAADRVRERFGPEFVRAWRLYLAGSVAGFRAGTMQLFQIAFAGSACRKIPWTRAHIYAQPFEEAKEPAWIRAMS